MSFNKENFVDRIISDADDSISQPNRRSPHSRKARSKSLGGGILPSSKKATVNRRKSVLVNRALLDEGDDTETKRRAARRKSLANRRVSFAPEATLHTWDVIEYIKDATGRSESQSDSPKQEPPQPKRRVSGVPAPPPTEPEHEEETNNHENDNREGNILDFGEGSSSDSDAGNVSNNDEDMSIVAPNTEISAVLQPWTKNRQAVATPLASRSRSFDESDSDDGMDMSMDITRTVGGILSKSRRQSAVSMVEGDMSMDITQAIGGILGQTNAHDSYGSYNNHARDPANSNEGENMDLSMDITQAVGRILDQGMSAPQSRDFQAQNSDAAEDDDMTMDMTRPIGGLIQPEPELDSSGRRVSLKRRLSELTAVYGITPTQSPSQEAHTQHSSKRRSIGEGMSSPMELTTALGGIRAVIEQTTPKAQTDTSTDGAANDVTLGEADMDVTLAIGGILRKTGTSFSRPNDSDDDTSMELMGMLGQINSLPLPSFQSQSSDGRRSTSLSRRVSELASEGESEMEMDETTASSSTGLTPRLNTLLSVPATEEPISSTTPELPVRPSSRKSIFDLSDQIRTQPTYPTVLEYTPAKSPSQRSTIPTSTPEKLTATANRTHTLVPENLLEGTTPLVPIPEETEPSPSLRRSFVGARRSIGRPSVSAQSPKIDNRPNAPEFVITPPLEERAEVVEKRVQEITAETAESLPEAPEQPVHDSFSSTSTTDAVLNQLTVHSPKEQPLLSNRKSILGTKNPLTNWSESLKLLSTPTKGSQLSPKKMRQILARNSDRNSIAPSPRKLPPASASPAKRASPMKRGTGATPVKKSGLRFEIAESTPEREPENGPEKEPTVSNIPTEDRISLSDFLNLTKVQFLELTATKRRHTAAPSTFGQLEEEDEEDQTPLQRLQDRASAGACVIPMLSLFQHSCREMRHYISGGRDEIRAIETEAFENQPPLFRAYLAAPLQERATMDNQFKNMKTAARLVSKAGWYSWRGQLLRDLVEGLKQAEADLAADEKRLEPAERVIADRLPSIESYYADLQLERERLGERANQYAGTNKKELRAARDRLIEAESAVANRRARLDELERELSGRQNELAELEQATAKSRRISAAALEAISAEGEGTADNWTAARAMAVKNRVEAIVGRTGWAVAAADADAGLSLVYRSVLTLTLHPAAFLTSRPPDTSLPLTDLSGNRPIRLAYTGADERHGRPAPPLSAAHAFVLGRLQDQLGSFPQRVTRVRAVLDFVSRAWDDVGTRLAESARLLRQSFITREHAAGPDEYVATASLIMPSLATKVLVIVAVRLHFSFQLNGGGGGGFDISVGPTVSTSRCYGERYDDAKLSDFLNAHAFAAVPDNALPDPTAVTSAVTQLKLKLLSRGRQRGPGSGGPKSPGAAAFVSSGPVDGSPESAAAATVPTAAAAAAAAPGAPRPRVPPPSSLPVPSRNARRVTIAVGLGSPPKETAKSDSTTPTAAPPAASPSNSLSQSTQLASPSTRMGGLSRTPPQTQTPRRQLMTPQQQRQFDETINQQVEQLDAPNNFIPKGTTLARTPPKSDKPERFERVDKQRPSRIAVPASSH